jgi:hypothetical protein
MAKMLDFIDELVDEKLKKEREARKSGTIVY